MRVIGGTARGRTLAAPKGERTRPTSDLVRGALFNVLENLDVGWERVLDLFAGSGALGIEALSRGAGWADFVEEDAGAVAAIRQNLAATGLGARAGVHRQDVFQSLRTLRGPYDIILADPPYALAALPRFLEALAESELVGPGTAVVVEHARRRPLPEAFAGLVLAKQKRHGDTLLSIYRREGRP
jgi:16S rRNA (guanine966-N2)-methyltransferase